MGEKKGLSFFEKYLSLWVALCIMAGIADTVRITGASPPEAIQ
jgi:ACR3 family arsenite efflux pump ArsB